MPTTRFYRTTVISGMAILALGVVGMTIAAPSSATTTASTTTSTTLPASDPVINGVGSTVIDPAIGAWSNALAEASVPEQIDYTGGGDANAEPAFASNNFAVDGGPDFLANEYSLLPQTQEALARAGQQVAFAPVSATGLGFVFALRLEKCVKGVPSDKPGTQVASLNLTPDLLAGMFFSQTILYRGTKADFKYAVDAWNQPQILALNPGLGTTCGPGVKDVLAGGYSDESIFPIARQDAAPENQALASFFSQAAPTVWKLYLSLLHDAGYAPSDQFPWDPSNLSLNGYIVPNESAQLTDLVGGNNDSFATPYFQTITYMTTSDLSKEQSYFAGAHLTPAIVNLVPNSVTSLPASGVAPVGPTISAVGQALQGRQANPDGTYRMDYGFTNTSAWPIPLITYLVVPLNHLAKDSAAPLADLVDLAASKTGQAELAPLGWPVPTASEPSTYGYTPLTAALQPYANAASAVGSEVENEGSSLGPPTGKKPSSATGAATTTPSSGEPGSGFPGVAGSGGTTSFDGASGPGTSTDGVSSAPEGGAASSALGGRTGLASGGSKNNEGRGSSRPAQQAVFVSEGRPLPPEANGSLWREAFGKTGPWLIALGGGSLFVGLWLRRRDHVSLDLDGKGGSR